MKEKLVPLTPVLAVYACKAIVFGLKLKISQKVSLECVTLLTIINDRDLLSFMATM